MDIRSEAATEATAGRSDEGRVNGRDDYRDREPGGPETATVSTVISGR